MKVRAILVLATLTFLVATDNLFGRYDATDQLVKELNETIKENSKLTSEQNEKMMDYTLWLLFLTIAITAMTIINVYFARPAPPQPNVGKIKLYGNTNADGLIFVCEFNAINNGGGSCFLNDVNIIHNKLNFQKGGTTETGHTDFESGFSNKQKIYSTELPEFIGQYDREKITIVGFGKWREPFVIPEHLDVEITFMIKQRPVVIPKCVRVSKGSFNLYQA